MPVPKEELLKDLETPEYQSLVKETLAKKDFIIQDKTEHTSYLDRYKKDILEKEMPAEVKKIWDGLDNDVKTIFNIDRETNEKSYDYLKRAAKVGALDKLAQSDAKIKELEKAIADGKGGEAIQKKLEQEEAKFARLIKERDQKIAELERQTQVTAKSADIKLLYGEIKKNFVKQLPPLFDVSERAILDEVINQSVAKDGKLYMANSDGSIRKDGSYNEITVESYLKSAFKDVIETPKPPKGGAGSNPNAGGGTDPGTLTADNFPMREDLKTKAALTDYMVSLGLKQGTKQFTEIWRKFGLPMTA